MPESAKTPEIKPTGLEGTESTADNSDSPFSFANLDAEVFVRGAAPCDIEKKCLDLCRNYIGGIWNKTSSEKDIIVSRLAGGMTNQSYRIRLNDQFEKLATTEATDVVYKMYMSKYMKNYDEKDGERFNDNLIAAILSESGIGPIMYGIFKDGYICQYVENEDFGIKHQQNPQLLQKLAQQLARVHHLNVPISKCPDLLLRDMGKILDYAYDSCNAQSVIDGMDFLKYLNKTDPREEFKLVKQWIDHLNSPVVFFYNDFRGNNILVTKPNQDIKLIDLENAGYGYRGHDIANYLREWGWEAHDFEHHDLPKDDVLRHFVKLYIDACDQLMPGYSTKPENSIETLMKEVKIHTLEIYICFVCFLMKFGEKLFNTIDYDAEANLKYTDFLYGKYFEIKQRLVGDGTIKI